MLLNNFFFIDALQHDESSIQATIHIDEKHDILKGHFPSQAILPGVCMLEMLREVLEKVFQCRLQMSSAQTIKFLAMFIPTQNTEAKFVISYIQQEDGKYMVDASLIHHEILFMKCKSHFTTK